MNFFKEREAIDLITVIVQQHYYQVIYCRLKNKYISEQDLSIHKTSISQKKVSFLLKLPFLAQNKNLRCLERKYTTQNETAKQIRAV